MATVTATGAAAGVTGTGARATGAAATGTAGAPAATGAGVTGTAVGPRANRGDRGRRRAPARTAAVDFAANYVIPPDLRVVQRDATTVQIGTESPRRALLVDAPPDAGTVLAGLTGHSSAGEVVARSGGDPLVWRSVLGALVTAGLLEPAPPERPRPPHLAGERLCLIHRHGPAAADRLLAARADALVVVDGDGAVADTVSALLAASGIGHVHRPTVPPRRASAWRAAPDVRVHRPAPQMPPTAVVLAAQTLPDLARAAELTARLVPHLAVRVTQARVIVGPLVLPGSSACLNCVERHRAQADPGWPAVARSLRAGPVVPGPLLAQSAAELACGQILELVDGLREPDALGATLERAAGSLQVHRRRWTAHPECGCQLLSGQL